MAHNSLILVDRGGANYHVEAEQIDDRLKSGDKVLVQRDGNLYRATYDGSHTWANIRDGDTLIVWNEGVTEKATGAQFKSLFNSLPPLPTASLTYNYGGTVPYGSTYKITWSSTDGESYSGSWLSGSPGASGSKNFLWYPTGPTIYMYTYTVTNEAGTDSKTLQVRVNGANYSKCAILGLPSQPRGKSSANLYIGSVPGILSRTTYKWTITAPTAEDQSHIDDWIAFGDSIFSSDLTSTSPNPTIQFKNKSHKENGDVAIGTGHGKVPGGFILKCKLYNPDNNDQITFTESFIIKPQA